MSESKSYYQPKATSEEREALRIATEHRRRERHKALRDADGKRITRPPVTKTKPPSRRMRLLEELREHKEAEAELRWLAVRDAARIVVANRIALSAELRALRLSTQAERAAELTLDADELRRHRNRARLRERRACPVFRTAERDRIRAKRSCPIFRSAERARQAMRKHKHTGVQ